MFFYSHAAVVLVQLRFVAAQECPLPNDTAITQGIRQLVGGSSLNITLIKYHFTCLAVEGLNMYSSLSVAVKYNRSDMEPTQTGQFQMRCDFSSLFDTVGVGMDGLEQNIPETVFQNETRRDCWGCAANHDTNFDPSANCIGKATISVVNNIVAVFLHWEEAMS